MSPIPNHMMETGIHAIGLMGRIWMVGFTTDPAAGYHPSSNPAGMPRKTAAT